MNPKTIFSNKLFRIIGIVVIIYFALFYDKNTPDSLGNRASPEKIKEKITNVISVKQDIANGFVKAKIEEESIIKESPPTNDSEIIIYDLQIGSSSKALSCLDEATISYRTYTNKNNEEISVVKSQKITIGSKQNLALEKNIVGMKKGGIRNVTLTTSYKTNDSALQNTIQNGLGLTYEVILLEFQKSNLDKSINCD